MKDPVCGMTVLPDKAAGSSEFKGETQYFCSVGCKRKFDASPEQFRVHEQAAVLPPASPTPAAIDPVCGMKVDPAKAAATLEQDGTRYFFCGQGCAAKFRADPQKYLDTRGLSHRTRHCGRAEHRVHLPDGPRGSQDGSGRLPEVRHGA